MPQHKMVDITTVQLYLVIFIFRHLEESYFSAPLKSSKTIVLDLSKEM